MKNGDKHTHHYLSKFYLKSWADTTNKVWVYELNSPSESRRPNPSLLHIDKICSDYHLYSIGEDNISIENWSDKHFESRCAKTFRKISASEKINDDDVFYIKAFLALTIARHPLLKEVSEIIANLFSRRTKPLNPLAQTIPLRVRANLIEFEQINLLILYIPNDMSASFVTSDVPFVISWSSIREKIFEENELTQVQEALKDVGDFRTIEEIFGKNEITRPTFERIWFPISPKALCFLSKMEFSSLYEKIIDTAYITNLNSKLLSFSKDILIAKDPDVFKSLPKFSRLT